MVTYNSSQFTRDIWTTFERLFSRLAKSLGASAWSACIEESLHSVSSTTRYHLHGYLWWRGGDGFARRNTDELVFNGVRPRVDVCTRSNPWRLEAAAQQGLFYVYIQKSGTVAAAGNYKPWRDYTPKPQWLDGWWLAQKLTHTQYMEYSVQLRCGHAGRKRDWEEVRRGEREQAIDRHIEKELALVHEADPPKTVKVFPEVDAFVDSFKQPRQRRPVLAIIGGTNLGKSMLAADVLLRVAEVLGVSGFLEVTVEGDASLDLSEFSLADHAGVLLDGIGDVMMLKAHREALQGRAKKCRGGKSATMMYSYAFTLCRRAVVATFDLSARNLHMLSTDHWLSDARNVVVLRLVEPSWVTECDTPVQAPIPMAAWTVSQVAHWLASSDMAGPASTLQMQGVSGEDLLGFATAAHFPAMSV